MGGSRSQLLSLARATPLTRKRGHSVAGWLAGWLGEFIFMNEWKKGANGEEASRFFLFRIACLLTSFLSFFLSTQPAPGWMLVFRNRFYCLPLLLLPEQQEEHFEKPTV